VRAAYLVDEWVRAATSPAPVDLLLAHQSGVTNEKFEQLTFQINPNLHNAENAAFLSRSITSNGVEERSL
jgi:hypothetical protein